MSGEFRVAHIGSRKGGAISYRATDIGRAQA